MNDYFFITTAGEGPSDEAVIERIVDHVGGKVAISHLCSGKQDLLRRLPGFNRAAQLSPWFVLVDLDAVDCAPPFVGQWLPQPASQMCFRVAVRELEAWLLADRVRVATFLGVRQNAIPADPEELQDPKQTLVNIAQKSRLSTIRDELVPHPASGRLVGAGYTGRIIEFATKRWRPEAAAERAESLRRCLHRLTEVRDAA